MSAVRQGPRNDEESDAGEGDGVAGPERQPRDLRGVAAAFAPKHSSGRGDDGPQDRQSDNRRSIDQGIEKLPGAVPLAGVRSPIRGETSSAESLKLRIASWCRISRACRLYW
jgi:hypothetical protein